MQLSIIIPIYNDRKYLRQCLESIIREIDEETEIIIVNDGSIEVIDDIINLYKNYNIKYFKISHQGVSIARNVGIEASSGKWLMFVDADDYLKNSWYQKVSRHFNSDSDVIYFSPLKNDNNKETVIKSIIGLNNDNSFMITPTSKLYCRELTINNAIRFKRGVINGEDQLFNLEFIAKAKKYEIVNESIYFYRTNLESSTHTFREEIFASCEIYLQDLNRILNENNIFEKNLYLEQSLKGILCTLINRISLLNTKGQKRYISYLKQNRNLINYIKRIKISKIKTKQDLIVYLLKKNLYFTAALMFTGKRMIKRIRNLFIEKNEENTFPNIADFQDSNKSNNVLLIEEKRQYLRKKFELLAEAQKRRAKAKKIFENNKYSYNNVQINLNIPKLLRKRKKSDTINNKRR